MARRLHPVIESNFEIRTTNEAAWYWQARRLKYAAGVLFDRYASYANTLDAEKPVDLNRADDMELVITASLLYGLALENALKGITIKQKAPTSSEFRTLFGKGAPHDLLEFAKRASFRLSRDERDVVRRLSAYVLWAGRYPVAKRAEQMAVKQKRVSPASPPLPLQGRDINLYGRLFERALKTICK